MYQKPFLPHSGIGGENYFGPNLLGKVASAPLGRAKVQFLEEIGEIWTAKVVNLVILASF